MGKVGGTDPGMGRIIYERSGVSDVGVRWVEWAEL